VERIQEAKKEREKEREIDVELKKQATEMRRDISQPTKVTETREEGSSMVVDVEEKKLSEARSRAGSESSSSDSSSDSDSDINLETIGDEEDIAVVERKQAKLATRGIKLEAEIRNCDPDADNEELLSEWFDLVNKRNKLVMREDQLRLREEEQKLKQLGDHIERSLRPTLAKDTKEKSPDEIEEEEWLISLWVDCVKKRDELVQQEEEQRKAAHEFDPNWAIEQISVTIPTFFLTTDGGQPYHLYTIQVIIKGVCSWTVKKRYSQFRDELHAKWKHIPNLPPFPSKKILGKNDEHVAEERRPQLENYLREIVKHVVTENNSPLMTNDPQAELVKLIPFLIPDTDTLMAARRPSSIKSQKTTKSFIGFTTMNN